MNHLVKALLVLGTSAVLASADDPADTTYQLNVAVAGYKSKSKFIDHAWKNIIDGDDDATDDDAIKVFDGNCAQGSSTFQELGPDGIDFTKIGLSKKDLERWEAQDTDEKFFKKVMGKAADKYKFDTKLYWVSTPEQAAKPECNKNKVFDFMMTQVHPNTKSNLKLLKLYSPVALDKGQFDACVARDTAGVIEEPVCTTLGPDASAEEKAIVNACTACSISNSLVASAFGAAAMVALAVFF